MAQDATPPADARRLGELLFVGFDGTEMTVGLRSFLRDVRPGGIILFKRNIAGPEHTLRLIADLRALRDPPPILAVDEEGGQVSRLRAMAPTLPPAATLAGLGDARRVREMAGSMGGILAALGFDLDFAPVVDLCPRDAPNGIGDRSFGTDAEAACATASAYLDGLSDAGLLGCLKHFPGLGPTLSDSHHHLPTVQKEEARFLREDLLPYRRLHAQAPVIMIGHGHYPFLAGDDPIAATLVPRIATGLLRSEVGFEGLALADDLEMKAVSARVPFDELAPRVIAAGCDMALVCRRPEAIRASLDALRSWAASGRLCPARIAEATARVEALREAARKARRAGPSLDAFRAACVDLSARLEAVA